MKIYRVFNHILGISLIALGCTTTVYADDQTTTATTNLTNPDLAQTSSKATTQPSATTTEGTVSSVPEAAADPNKVPEAGVTNSVDPTQLTPSSDVKSNTSATSMNNENPVTAETPKDLTPTNKVEEPKKPQAATKAKKGSNFKNFFKYGESKTEKK